MSNERGPSHAVMESRGAYNKPARLPADGAALTLPLLKKAIKEVGLCSSDQPIVIADCGSSQGKNSLAAMTRSTCVLPTIGADNNPHRTNAALRMLMFHL